MTEWDSMSETARKAVLDGLRPKTGKLTDAQALIERLEAAAQAGTSPSMRRKLLLEAAAWIRAQSGVQRSEKAA